MMMTGSFDLRRTSSSCSSSPSMSGIRTSATRQPCLPSASLVRKARADSKVSTRKFAELRSAANESRTSASSSTTKTVSSWGLCPLGSPPGPRCSLGDMLYSPVAEAQTLAGAEGFGETHGKLFFGNGTLTLGVRSASRGTSTSRESPALRGALLEERNDALFGPLRRRAGPIVEVNREDGMGRHGRRRRIFRIELDGLELISEYSFVGFEPS